MEWLLINAIQNMNLKQVCVLGASRRSHAVVVVIVACGCCDSKKKYICNVHELWIITIYISANFELWPLHVGSNLQILKKRGTVIQACSQGQVASLCQFVSGSDVRHSKYSSKLPKLATPHPFSSSP